MSTWPTFDLSLFWTVPTYKEHSRMPPTKDGHMDCLETTHLSFPGLAFSETLANMGNNTTLYCRLALLFIEQHSQDLTEIEAALEQGNRELAVNLIHTLRGTAGNIGAITLYHSAGELESEVRGSESITTVPHEVKQAMTELLS
ncbi:MAG: two-component system sensor histidine kinase/response regulator, partial [Candidatus Krumholzibacteriia bacterium]